MSKNRWVNTHFWSDDYVMDLDPSEKLLFLYCLTSDNTSLCGAYEANLKHICLETGFDREMVLKIFDRFKRDNKIAYIDGYVIVRNFRKHQADNPKIREGIKREESKLPEHIKDSLYIGFDTVRESTNTLLKPILKPKLSTTSNEVVPFSNGYALWMEEWTKAMGFTITKRLKENENALKSCIKDSSADTMHQVLAYLHWLKTTKKSKERPHWFQYTTGFVKIRDFWDNIMAAMSDDAFQQHRQTEDYGDFFNR